MRRPQRVLRRPGSGGGAPLPEGSEPLHAGPGRFAGVRHGGPGVPGPPWLLRRGWAYPGHIGSAGRALHRQQLCLQRHGYGQGHHQALYGRRGHPHRSLARRALHRGGYSRFGGEAGDALRREDRQRRQLHRRGAAGHQGGAGGCPAPYAPIWRPCGGGKENQGPGDPGGCFG